VSTLGVFWGQFSLKISILCEQKGCQTKGMQKVPAQVDPDRL
jgi:hypothetical protein